MRFLNTRERNLKAEFKMDHLALSLVQADIVFLKTELSGKSDNEEITCFWELVISLRIIILSVAATVLGHPMWKRFYVGARTFR